MAVLVGFNFDEKKIANINATNEMLIAVTGASVKYDATVREPTNAPADPKALMTPKNLLPSVLSKQLTIFAQKIETTKKLNMLYQT